MFGSKVASGKVESVGLRMGGSGFLSSSSTSSWICARSRTCPPEKFLGMVGSANSVSDDRRGDGGDDSSLAMLAESQAFQSTELLDELTWWLFCWYGGGEDAPEF